MTTHKVTIDSMFYVLQGVINAYEPAEYDRLVHDVQNNKKVNNALWTTLEAVVNNLDGDRAWTLSVIENIAQHVRQQVAQEAQHLKEVMEENERLKKELEGLKKELTEHKANAVSKATKKRLKDNDDAVEGEGQTKKAKTWTMFYLELHSQVKNNSLLFLAQGGSFVSFNPELKDTDLYNHTVLLIKQSQAGSYIGNYAQVQALRAYRELEKDVTKRLGKEKAQEFLIDFIKNRFNNEPDTIDKKLRTLKLIDEYPRLMFMEFSMIGFVSRIKSFRDQMKEDPKTALWWKVNLIKDIKVTVTTTLTEAGQAQFRYEREECLKLDHAEATLLGVPAHGGAAAAAAAATSASTTLAAEVPPPRKPKAKLDFKKFVGGQRHPTMTTTTSTIPMDDRADGA